jgi:hypothetical protein
MDATAATVEQLLQDLYDHEDVSYETISGDGLFFTYLRGKPNPPRFWIPSTSQSGWFRLEGEEWGLWSRLDAIKAVRFVRAPEHDDPERETLSIRLVGPNDRPWLGCTFVGLYDEQKRPVPARFARWEALRAKYGSRDELRVENGLLICPAEGKG